MNKTQEMSSYAKERVKTEIMESSPIREYR